MTTPNPQWFPLETVVTFFDPATGQRQTLTMQGKQRRQGQLTPQEREKYQRFFRRQKAQADTQPNKRKSA